MGKPKNVVFECFECKIIRKIPIKKNEYVQSYISDIFILCKKCNRNTVHVPLRTE